MANDRRGFFKKVIGGGVIANECKDLVLVKDAIPISDGSFDEFALSKVEYEKLKERNRVLEAKFDKLGNYYSGVAFMDEHYRELLEQHKIGGCYNNPDKIFE